MSWSADVPLAFSSAAVSSRIWHKAVITSGLMCRSCSSSTAAASCIAVSWPASACFRFLVARGHVMPSRSHLPGRPRTAHPVSEQVRQFPRHDDPLPATPVIDACSVPSTPSEVKAAYVRLASHALGRGRAWLAANTAKNPHLAGISRLGPVGPPVRDLHQPGIDQLQPGEEPEDLFPATQRRPRRHLLVVHGCVSSGLAADIAGHVRQHQVAARLENVADGADDRGRICHRR